MTPLCFGQGGGKHQQAAVFTCAGGFPMVKTFRKTQFCPSLAESPAASKPLHGDCQEEGTQGSLSMTIASCASHLTIPWTFW